MRCLGFCDTDLFVEVGDEEHCCEGQRGRGERAEGGRRRRQSERAERGQAHASHTHSVGRSQAWTQA